MSNVDVTTQSVTDDSGPPRRRSARLSSPSQTTVKSDSVDKHSQVPVPPVVAKRSITVRKIAPRKTNVLTEDNKGIVQRPSGGSLQKNLKMSTPEPAQVPLTKATTLLSSQSQTLANSAPPVVPKRSIAVRKIAPRKTNALSEDNKENSQTPSGGSLQKKPKIPTPGPAQVPLPKATMLSPILAPVTVCPQALADPQDSAWSQKVRRSYSRLSQGDRSFESPQPQDLSSPSLRRRDSLFGFERLQTPEVVRKTERSNVSGSLCGVSSFTLLEGGDTSAAPSPGLDVNIPGVLLVKEKRKRMKRVPQMELAELEVLAAQMNAQYEEAEGFELVVE